MQIVTITNDQPVTTTIAIAQGTNVEHASVISLVRKYQSDLEEFGHVDLKSTRQERGGHPIEYAELNEQQSTLILTYMRNSEIVRVFKKRLVKEFWDMRAKLAAQTPEYDELVQLNVTVPKSLRKAIKHTAALQETTTTALLLQAIHSVIEQPKQEPKALPATKGVLDGPAEREFTAAYHLAQMLGCDANTAALRANAVVLKATGTDVLALLGHSQPDVPVTEPVKVNASGYYNPSDLIPGVNGMKMNKILEDAGLQSKLDGRWISTKIGLKYSRICGAGLFDYRLQWTRDVLNQVALAGIKY